MAEGDAKPKAKKRRLGGMALRNGLLVHGPTHWAAAVRRSDGSIEVASERKPELVPGLVAKVPGLRGPINLAESMLVLPLVRKRMRSARMPFEDKRVIGATAATLALSSLLRRNRPAPAPSGAPRPAATHPPRPRRPRGRDPGDRRDPRRDRAHRP